MRLREFLPGKSSIQLISEARAMKGDYAADEQFKETFLSPLSKIVFENNWEDCDNIDIDGQIMKIIASKSDDTYAVGYWRNDENQKTIFQRICVIQLIDCLYLASKLKTYPEMRQVTMIFVTESFRSTKIAKKMYQWFVQQGFSLIGDVEQYFGARKLWCALSKISTLRVDVVNRNTGTIIQQGRIIEHGELDHEFDNEIWAYDSSKNDIGLILIDIR
jgi:hypothetical protein